MSSQVACLLISFIDVNHWLKRLLFERCNKMYFKLITILKINLKVGIALSKKFILKLIVS